MNFLKISLNLISLAFKNLWRRKIRTVLTVIAVSIGTTAVVSLVALATGAKRIFISQLEKTGALTRITVIASNQVESVNIFGGGFSDVEGEKMTDETVKEVKALPHVLEVSPQFHVHTLKTISLKDSDKKYRLDVSAVEPNSAIEMPTTAGRKLNASRTGEIVISYKIAQAFSKDTSLKPQDLVGKTAVLTLEKGLFTQNMPFPEEKVNGYLQQREILYRRGQRKEADEIKNPLDEIINTVEAEIVGIGVPGPQERESYINLDWGQELLTRKHLGGAEYDRYGNLVKYETDVWDEIKERGYQTLIAKIDDVDHVEATAEEIKTRLGRGAITAKDFLDAFLRLFLIIQIVLGGIGAIALLVASIGIINTMLMAILERTKEIGLYKAVGATGGMVGWIFTFEAGLIGLLGGGAGIGAGIGIAQIVNKIATHQLAAQNFAVEEIISFPLWLIISSLIFPFFLGITSGLYPALRAARLNPIDALRAE
ncbi:hypothetical protein B5M47_03010 [candidate division CPR3 bacterium 4484_211]|uniref:ABC3 transporter permease protein domain-containing protein n=1 Tax=candidate division CPR3 bacterium 4484_211 TaxID=1968527 RepID=A0A1W9NXC2_UNCC3|nr:MAG: hypothetical protein B5M47_03010 [candidate division CPR3 bacterium 4484_211]